MGDIYIDIGPMDSSKAPKQYAEKAKAAMENAVERAVKGASGFTADRKGNGYTVRLKVAELKVEPKGVSCKLTGEILRNPKSEMFTTSLTGSAKADGGKPDSLVADCIEGAVEGMMKKALPEMKKQARP
jgi:hypothetical protein